jgi:CHAP domain
VSWNWDEPYPGAPMVGVRGFPRPCYPPDAAPGHRPSADGPDIEAYKRTISRAGRWKWQAFDQAFSNSFSRGKSGGNVADSGVAGVQRQQNIQPTGWVGKDTFNLLRSIKIPAGLPNAGQMAMDARSVELINAAFDKFGGEEPSPGGTSAAEARLKEAVSQLGIKESPMNSNQCKYTQWYGMLGPWCAMFVSWCDAHGGKPTPTFIKGQEYAYVPYIVSDARLGANGLSIVSTPKPGDLVCYDWAWDGEYDHVGIVEEPPDASGNFEAIEGNTSTSNNSNGGQVMRRSRNKKSQATVFVRVREP